MNTGDYLSFTAQRPRLFCRVVRMTGAVTDRRNPRHLASCPACQAYFRGAESMENALRRDALRAGHTITPSPTLEADILRAVRISSPAPAPRSSHRYGTWVASGLTAAVAIIVGVFTPRREPSPVVSQADAKAIARAVETISSRWVDTIIPTAGELVGENPLQRELGFVYSDVRSALDFLALNFSPTTSTVPAQSRQRIGIDSPLTL